MLGGSTASSVSLMFDFVGLSSHVHARPTYLVIGVLVQSMSLTSVNVGPHRRTTSHDVGLYCSLGL